MFIDELSDSSVSSVSSTHVAVAQVSPPQDSAGGPLLQQDQPAVGQVIRELSNGVRKAEDLDAQTRHACVFQLSLDGFSNEDIACILRISERTVTRDRKAVRKAHALKPDCELADELLGEFQEYAMNSIRRLTRLCNDMTTPPAVRVRAEEAIARIYQRFTEQIRRFSYAQDGAERLANQQYELQPEAKLPENASYEERVMATMQRMGARYR